MTTTKRQARNSRFQKGTGMFACECCGRNTRDTGVVSVGARTCEECWELAGIENGISDGSPQSDYQNDIDTYAKSLISKGISFADITRLHGGIIDWSKTQLDVFVTERKVPGGVIQTEGERYTVHTSIPYWRSEKAISHLDKLRLANEARRAQKLAKKAK